MKKFSIFLFALCSALLTVSCASTSKDDDQKDESNRGIIKYVALGASDATGIGAFPLTNGYVFRIKHTLEKNGKKVDLLNLGIPTANISAIEKAATAVQIAGVHKNLVTIWTGANDIIGGENVEEFEISLEIILKHIRKDNSVIIAIMNIPDLTKIKRFRVKPDRHVTSERVTAFNNAITRQSKKYNATVVDFFSNVPGDELVSDIDGFHPNNNGHQHIADLFLKVILPKFNI